MAEAPEASDNFIGQVQHVVLTANLETAFMVALWWHDNAPRGKNGFGDKYGTAVCANI